jgi:hypothetical protein
MTPAISLSNIILLDLILETDCGHCEIKYSLCTQFKQIPNFKVLTKLMQANVNSLSVCGILVNSSSKYRMEA